jgi:TatD DNase family protein
MFAQIPLEKTLLETDAPFLAPKGKRGRKNQPAWTALVAEDLAEKRGLSVEEIAKITEQNVNNLFNLGK